MLLDDYFAHTDMPGRLTKFEPDQYRTPYLKQAIVRRHRDAISAFVREHVAQGCRAALQSVSTLAALARGATLAGGAAAGTASAAPSPEAGQKEQLSAAAEELAAALRGTGPPAERRLIVNPLSFARRIGVELAGWNRPPDVAGSVIATGRADGRSFAVVDVPAMGFAWISPGATTSTSRGTPIARDNVLVNEFFELTVSTKTGGIQSLYDFAHRGNQFSQQIAFRSPGAAAEPGSAWRDPDEDSQYSRMRAEQVEISTACAAFGEIVSRGTLIGADEQPLARFRQSVQAWSGSRVIRLEIELDALQEPPADPWNSYFAARFAWPDEMAQLWRGVGLARQRTDAARLEAPEYVDVESQGGHVTILTGGLPYHRRAGERMLDSLLVVRGETTRKFSLGIGVSLPQPAASAIEFLTPAVRLRCPRARQFSRQRLVLSRRREERGGHALGAAPWRFGRPICDACRRTTCQRLSCPVAGDRGS